MARARCSRSIAPLLLLAAGCNGNNAQLILTVTSTRPVEVDELTVHLTRADQTTADLTLLQGQVASLPPSREFTVSLKDKQAQAVTLELRARIRGADVTTLQENTTLTPGASARLALDLLPQPALALVAGLPGGSGNADGQGLAARFYNPGSIAADGAGNLFIADTGNCIVRQMVIASAAVTTLAGTAGMCGSPDGVGAAARFVSPRGIAADGAGNVFVADADNHTIRRIVVATGVVTTLAGMPGMVGNADGIGSAAAFQVPSALAADGAGNVFVADTYNHTIRRIVVATGEVSTLAGQAGVAGSDDGIGTAAAFDTPAGIAADNTGNVFVADTANHTIRQIVVATGEVTTLAGSAGVAEDVDGVGAAAHFIGPTGLGLDGAGDLLVTENSVIRRIAIASATVTRYSGIADNPGATDGGPETAQFASPNAIAADGAGNLFVADTENQAIRRIVMASGQVTTVAGAPAHAEFNDGTLVAARFRFPTDVAADGAGNLFVVDSGDQIIRRIALATGEVSTLAGSPGLVGGVDGIGDAARFRVPTGIVADRAGNLYVTDRFNNTIRSIKIATGEVITLAGLARAAGSADGNADAARFRAPAGITLDGSDTLYIAEEGNSTIRKLVISTGDVTTLAGTALSDGSDDGIGAAARFAQPDGITSDGNGFLYVADLLNNTIRRVRTATGEVTTLAGMAGEAGSADGAGSVARFNGPVGITYDGNGGLLVTDQNNSTVRRVAIASGEVTTVAGRTGQSSIVAGPGQQGRLNGPRGLALLGRGLLAIVCTPENALLFGRGL